MPFGDWYLDYDYSEQIKEVVEPLLNNNSIYIIPVENKPIKIVHNELPCPKYPNTICKYAKMTTNEDKLEISIICSENKCL